MSKDLASMDTGVELSGSDGDDDEMERDAEAEEESEEDEWMAADAVDPKKANEDLITAAREALAANPYHYDSHVQLIAALRKKGDAEELRAAREAMSAVFPLTETLWLDWARDEEGSEEDLPGAKRDQIISLLERATKDYLSVDVWMELLKHLERRHLSGDISPDSPEVKALRDAYERAVLAAGLHLTEGDGLWEAYTGFENRLLDALEEGDAAESDVLHQTERVKDLFKRHLSLPLIGADETLAKFVEWADENEMDKKQFDGIYKQSAKLRDERLPFEKEVFPRDDVPAALDKWIAYLDFEIAAAHPGRIQNLFERAVKAHCLVPEIWQRYTTYLDLELKASGAVCIPVHERATRNVPWSGETWANAIRAHERAGDASHAKLKGLLDAARSSGLTSPAEKVSVALAYIDAHRRRFSQAGATDREARLKEARESFHGVSELVGPDGDPESAIARYHARFETELAKNIKGARDVWEGIMRKGHSKEYRGWEEWAQLERAHGSVETARSVLSRGCFAASDYPEALCDAWIAFERELGTLQDLDHARVKLAPRLKELAEKRAKQWAQSAEAQAQAVPAEAEKKGKKRKRDEKDEGAGPAKKKIKAKSGKPVSKIGHAKDRTVFIDNYPREHSVDQIKAVFEKAGPVKEIRPCYNDAGRPLGKAFIEYENEGAAQEAVNMTGVQMMNRAVTVSHAKDATEQDPIRKARTLHVGNLAWSVNTDDLRALFTDCGAIEEIRLAIGDDKRPKGFAFVEFEDEASIANGLALHDLDLKGRKIAVTRAAQPKAARAPTTQPIAEEPKTVFVSNLPWTSTQAALEAAFKEFGEIKEVRMPMNFQGKPKGIAYIEYTNEESAAKAVQKLNNTKMGDRDIFVAISKPTKARLPQGARSGFGGGRGGFGRGHGAPHDGGGEGGQWPVAAGPGAGDHGPALGGGRRGRGRGNADFVPRRVGLGFSRKGGEGGDQASTAAPTFVAAGTLPAGETSGEGSTPAVATVAAAAPAAAGSMGPPPSGMRSQADFRKMLAQGKKAQ